MKKIKLIEKVVGKFMPKKGLVRNSALPQLTWTGSPTDLMENVYLLWLSGCVHNAQGRPATISELTNAMFSQYHMEVPKNPTKLINNIKHRKKPEKTSMMWRLVYQLYQMLLI